MVCALQTGTIRQGRISRALWFCPSFCSRGAQALPQQDRGSLVCMKWSTAELPCLGAKAEVGPLSVPGRVSLYIIWTHVGFYPICPSQKRLCWGCNAYKLFPLHKQQTRFWTSPAIAVPKQQWRVSPKLRTWSCSLEHKSLNSSKTLPHKGIGEVLSVRHRRGDTQILKFFSAPDLHWFPQQSGTCTPAVSHTSMTHSASDRKSAALQRRQLHSSGAHRGTSDTWGAVTLPLTPFKQHYFIMSARHNLLLEFSTFISALWWTPLWHIWLIFFLILSW